MRASIVLLAAFLAAPAAAQSIVPGPNQPGRYEMQPIEGGIARLDTVTGDVSLCRVERGTLRCRPSEDENVAAPDNDGNDVAQAQPAPKPDAQSETDADLDRALDRLKRAFRAFNDIVREFDGERSETAPHRT
jgi:hypothetical protein